MSWTHVFLVSSPRIWRAIIPVRALRASTGRTARSAPWRAPTGRVLMEEPAWRMWPAVTAAAARPGSPAPTARRESTDAAATPALMVRTNCSLQRPHNQHDPTSTHSLNFTVGRVSFKVIFDSLHLCACCSPVWELWLCACDFIYVSIWSSFSQTHCSLKIMKHGNYKSYSPYESEHHYHSSDFSYIVQLCWEICDVISCFYHLGQSFTCLPPTCSLCVLK